MVKNIKKLTVLLFVAATMFSFASCNKDDDNNGGHPSMSPNSLAPGTSKMPATNTATVRLHKDWITAN